MEINIAQIPQEGLVLKENISSGILDLDTPLIKFYEPLDVKAEVFKISNAVSVEVFVSTKMRLICIRCLQEFEVILEKNFKLHYSTEISGPVIDLNRDLREELILGYPLQPLCSPDCKGLCVRCGHNLNAGKCQCPHED